MNTIQLPGRARPTAFDAYRCWHGAIWGAFFGRIGWRYVHFTGGLGADDPALWVGDPLPPTAAYAVADPRLMNVHPDSPDARERWGLAFRDAAPDGVLLLPESPQVGNPRLSPQINAAKAAVVGWYLPPETPESASAGGRGPAGNWHLLLMRRPTRRGAADPAPVDADFAAGRSDPDLLENIVNDRMPKIGWIDAEFDALDAGFEPAPMPGHTRRRAIG